MNLSNDTTSAIPGFSDPGLFDRYQFLTESPGVAISVIVILLLAGLVGTCGNILILLALCVMKDMKSLESIFIANLAISDIKARGRKFLQLVPRALSVHSVRLHDVLRELARYNCIDEFQPIHFYLPSSILR